MKPELIITQSNQIREIASQINIWSQKRRLIIVRFSHLTAEENKSLEETITRHYGTCGCHQGRVAGIFTFIGYFLLVAFGIISIYNLGVWKTIFLYFLVSFIIMVIAKIAALIRARKALFSIAQQIESNIP
jgi:hypothetical protein